MESLPTWLQILLAFIAGGTVSKILDMIFAEPRRYKREHKDWLRREQLEAYAELAELLLSAGFTGKAGEEAFSRLRTRGKTARALLLTKNARVRGEIESLIELIYEFRMLLKMSTGDESTDEFNRARERMFAIVKDLKRLTPEVLADLRNELIEGS